MKPIDFDESNGRLEPPPDMENCEPLPIYADETGVNISKWELDNDDRDRIREGDPIWLHVWGKPPVWIMTEYPFDFRGLDPDLAAEVDPVLGIAPELPLPPGSGILKNAIEDLKKAGFYDEAMTIISDIAR